MAANPSIQLGTDGNWAIKEDNLLAYKKDGTRFFNKEFDFSRGSLATFIDKDGLVKVSGVADTELITNGNFSNGLNNWSSENTVLTQGGVRIESNGSTGSWIQQVDILTLNKTYKLQFEVTEVQQTGVLRVGFSSVGQTTITTTGTYTIHFVSSGTAFELVRNSAINVIVSNVSIKEIQTDVPRIDFKDDATGHLLLEPQSTNLITYSEDFSQVYWLKTSSTVSASTITDPSGNQNSFKLVPNSGIGGNRSLSCNFTGLSGLCIHSVFAKKGEYNYIALRTRNAPNVSVMFDLENGTFNVNTTAAAFNSAKIENYGNGWYKCSMTLDSSQLTSVGQIFNSFSFGITGSETHNFHGI